jgi:hypothetical protein
VLGAIDVREHKTQHGVAMGTPAYMAPEQVYDAATVDLRADLWAIGIILYEMTAGDRPFHANRQIALLSKVCGGKYPDAAEVRPNIDASVLEAIRGLLIVDPEQRIQDCVTLRGVLDGKPLDASTSAASIVGNDSETFVMGDVGAEVTRNLASLANLEPAPKPAPKPAPEQEVPPSASTLREPEPETTDALELAPTQELVPSPATWRTWRWVLLLLPALAAYSDALWPLEAKLWYPLLRTLQGPLAVDDAVVVSFGPEQDVRAMRPEYPALLDALVEAGATGVLFDVTLMAETEHDDAIAAAIVRAGEAGVPVVLPVLADTDPARIPENAALAAGPLGLVEFSRELLTGTVVRAPVQRRTKDGKVFWHAAVLAAKAHLGAKRAIEFDGNEIVIGGARNPTWAGLIWLHPVEEVEQLAWNDRESWGDSIQGRVVVFGTYGGARDLVLTPDGQRYGVEVHAGMVQTLVRQAALQVAPLWLNALWALLTAILTVLVALWVPENRRPVAALVPVASMALVLALMMANILVGLFPVLLAAIAAWAALRGIGKPT